MFQSKKALRQEIERLRNQVSQLERVEIINTMIKKYDLPKCESRICRACAYAAKEVTPWGQIVLQGCTKDLECKSFVPETKTVMVRGVREV